MLSVASERPGASALLPAARKTSFLGCRPQPSAGRTSWRPAGSAPARRGGSGAKFGAAKRGKGFRRRRTPSCLASQSRNDLASRRGIGPRPKESSHTKGARHSQRSPPSLPHGRCARPLRPRLARLRLGSAPAPPPAPSPAEGCATLGHKTKFVIFVGCDIHWAGQPCAGSPCVGTPWSLSLPFRPMVPVLSSSSDNVIGSKGLCVAASQTVQLNRWYTSTQNVRCFPRYCCFNSWNWQQFGSYFHSFQPQRWFRAVLRPHSRHPRWQPRFQAPLHKGGG